MRIRKPCIKRPTRQQQQQQQLTSLFIKLAPFLYRNTLKLSICLIGIPKVGRGGFGTSDGTFISQQFESNYSSRCRRNAWLVYDQASHKRTKYNIYIPLETSVCTPERVEVSEQSASLLSLLRIE